MSGHICPAPQQLGSIWSTSVNIGSVNFPPAQFRTPLFPPSDFRVLVLEKVQPQVVDKNHLVVCCCATRDDDIRKLSFHPILGSCCQLSSLRLLHYQLTDQHLEVVFADPFANVFICSLAFFSSHRVALIAVSGTLLKSE
jgi:hypothetical protein